jgi:hypothetical protein
MANAAAAQATVTLKHLAAALAETHEMAKKQSELILNDLVGLVTKHLKKGGNRGKSRGGTIIRFPGRDESDSFWEWWRLETLMIFRRAI